MLGAECSVLGALMRGGGRIELRDASRAEVARVTAHRWSQAWCMGPHRGRISQSRAMRCIAPGSARTAWSALVSRVVCGHSWGRSCGALASSPPWSVSVSCLVKSQTTNTTCSQIEIRKQTLRLYVIDMVIVYGPRSRTGHRHRPVTRAWPRPRSRVGSGHEKRQSANPNADDYTAVV